MQFDRFPREHLATLPTPLELLPRLGKELGGADLFAKRDDLTSLAIGGNKTRKLEFLMGEALAAGADHIITTGGLQSNHARQTAAAAARLGLQCDLVLTRTVPRDLPEYESSGNVMLDRLLGARLHVHEGGADRMALMEALAETLRRQGRMPFIIPTGGSCPTGALGYAKAALELVEQAGERGLDIDAIVLPASSGGTLAGLWAGVTALDAPIRLYGVDVDGEPERLEDLVERLAAETLSRLDLDLTPDNERLTIVAGHAGKGYGMPTEAMREAIELTARLEGLLLDPVYSGKAMAATVSMMRKKEFGPDETVVFLHTGGTPALFAYPDVFA